MTRSSLGPHGKRPPNKHALTPTLGMNKMVINHLEKLFVTSDAATIIREVEVHHPAAKMIAMAAKMQEDEAGDGTNMVISLAGELMSQAESLIKMGLHPSEILLGYEKASKECMEKLETLSATEIKDLKDRDEVLKGILSSIGAKQFGNHQILSNLVAEACVYAIARDQKSFNMDNVRVQKILGGALCDSEVVHGMVVLRPSETSVN